jgi:hemolysin III
MAASAGRAMSGATSSRSKRPEPLSTPKPRLRGRLHQAALFIAVPAGVRLAGAAPSGSVRVAMIMYALSMVGLFGASAAYHRLNWSPTALRRVRSLDHSMIFLLIAGTYTAFGVLVLHGLWRLLVLAVVWTGALVGITLKLVKIDGFSRAGGTLYMALGWIGIVALPQVLSESETLPLFLTVAGGLMYTVGAVVLLRRRPDPNPLVFGYHEIWHALVVAASTCHNAAITLLLRTTKLTEH